MPSGEESALTPAATIVELAGIFQNIQCVTSVVPLAGAPSVSCRITAKLTAPAGGLLHCSAGEDALGSAHEYCVGIMLPSLYAELISLNFDGGAAGACCAGACCAAALPIPN